MKKLNRVFTIGLFLLSSSYAFAFSERHDAGPKKLNKYHSDGFFAGGFKEVTTLTLKDVRRAQSQEGFERIVIDLESPIAQGIPYFQIQLAQNEGRIVVSLWSDVQYDFEMGKINKAFAKSSHIKKVNIVPRVEDGLSIIEMSLSPKAKIKCDAFYLTNPSRIILDLL